MTVTVNINNLSLVHKGSGGISMATLPDVCKTPAPGGPVPIPYPNIALSKDLAKGTKTVKADGGKMCANYGSEFSKSTGDEPGKLGGVKSGTFTKEATWITYSFDVKLENKGACRLTDKMFHNHQNTVNMAGVVQPALLAAHPTVALELEELCNMMCAVKDIPGPKQSLIAGQLKALDRAMGGRSTMKAEVPFNPKDVSPYMSKSEPWRATDNWFIPGHRRPDVVITDGGPPVASNIRAVVEMKFNDGRRRIRKCSATSSLSWKRASSASVRIRSQSRSPSPFPLPSPSHSGIASRNPCSSVLPACWPSERSPRWSFPSTARLAKPHSAAPQRRRGALPLPYREAR